MLLFQGFTLTQIPSIPFRNQMKVITWPTHVKFYNDKYAGGPWTESAAPESMGAPSALSFVSLFLELWAFWYPFRHSSVQLLVFKTVWYTALGLTLFGSCRQLSNVVLGSVPGGSEVKDPPAKQEMQVWALSQEDPLEKEMTTHFSMLPWRIPWTETPGRVQSMVSQRVGHKLETWCR